MVNALVAKKFLVYGLSLILFCSFVSASSVRINEIMYNPSGPDTNHEWIEIYNNGSEVDLTGWKFYENGVNHGLSLKQGDWILGNDEYAIITSDSITFLLDYPFFTWTLFDSSWSSLSNTGETLAIKNNSLDFIDSVSYSDSANEGHSLEFYNNDWYESLVIGGTPGQNNSYYTPNQTELKNCDWKIEILLNKYIFEENDDINWIVKVSRNNGEKTNVSVRGYVKDLLTDWQMDYKPWTDEVITNYRNKKYSPNLWVNKFYSIFFNITHLDCKDTDLGNNLDYKFIIVIPKKLDQNYTKIKINEFLPDPQGYDDAAMPEGEWIELYNSGDKDIDIEGLGLKDYYGSEVDIFISDSNTIGGTVISAHDYLVVYMNGRSRFLNNDGFEKISLYKDEYLIDEVTYSGSVEGLSWSKINNMWKLTLSTPDSDNYFDKTTNKSSLEIEEIYLGSDKKAKWGDIIRVKVMVYKGDTGKKSISLGLEQGLSKKTKFNAEDKFEEYVLTLPLQIDLNCNEKFEDDTYELILEGLGEKDSKKIKIEGKNNLCEKKSKSIKKEKTLTDIKKASNENTDQNYEKVIYRDMEEITGEIIYESSEIKAKRSAIFFFCAVLILLIFQRIRK